MARYLCRVSFTPAGTRELRPWRSVQAAPSNVPSWRFGETDVCIVGDVAASVCAAALGVAAQASGRARISTVVLLDPAEVDEIASGILDYQPSGA